MKKQKLQLDELRLDSFITTSQIKGGMKKFEDLKDNRLSDVPPSSDCDPTDASYTCPVGVIQFQ